MITSLGCDLLIPTGTGPIRSAARQIIQSPDLCCEAERTWTVIQFSQNPNAYWRNLAVDRFPISAIAFGSICVDSNKMTPIHAKVASTAKDGDQFRLIIDLVSSEFLGPFERLRFKRNPYCGSFSTSLRGSWLTLTYRKDPGYLAGDKFPLSRTD
jgi:hypothetical protein